MLRRVGGFHFVQDHVDPFRCLTEALDQKSTEEAGYISGSLIVLPEAFNLGKSYYPPDFPRITGTIGDAKVPLDRALAELQKIARERTIVFVAGLIGEQFSSAYWVHHKRPPELMCHKMGNDQSGNYRPCEGPDAMNPIQCEDACVGVLICRDAVEDVRETRAARKRRENLVRRVKESNRPHRIVCIPGHMGDDYKLQRDGLYWILANADRQTSFVKNELGEEVAGPIDPRRNEIFLAELPPATVRNKVPGP